MIERPMMLLLADDDHDDRTFFSDAVAELDISVNLTLVKDGLELMNLLIDDNYTIPHVIFLDINMPLKNGVECLREIKCNDKLKHIPIVMFTTAFNVELVNELYSGGVKYFIKKPNSFNQLKLVIERAISLLDSDINSKTEFRDFVLSY